MEPLELKAREEDAGIAHAAPRPRLVRLDHVVAAALVDLVRLRLRLRVRVWAGARTRAGGGARARARAKGSG